METLNTSHTTNLSFETTATDAQPRGPSTVRIMLACSLAVIMVLTMFGNIALIITIHRKSTLQSLTNRFILNLAWTDVALGLLSMPFSLVTCLTREWIFGDRMCQLNGFLNILFSLASLFTLTAISIEKYFSIVKPMAVIITTKMTWVMLTMTWIAALVFAITPLTGFTAFDFTTGSTQCGVKIPSTLAQTIHAFLVFVAAFLVPLCIMGFCYINIFRVARNHARRVNRMTVISNDRDSPLSSQKQIAATVFILLVVFILCWTPYFVFMLYMKAHKVESPGENFQILGLVSYWFIFLNSCINPLVYGVRNPLIRRELSWVCCLHGQRQHCLTWTCVRQSGDEGADSVEPPLAKTASEGFCDKTSSAYLTYINVAAANEEDAASPNESISNAKPTTDKSTQTKEAFKLLSIGELCRLYDIGQSIPKNMPHSTGFGTLSVIIHEEYLDKYTDSAVQVTCSSASSESESCSCQEDADSLLDSCEVTCSSGSWEIDCSDCGMSSETSSARKCEHDSSITLPKRHQFYQTVDELKQKNTRKAVVFTNSFKVGWIESQL